MSSVTDAPFPPEWEDDDRMNFLFSDFKENRDVNTTDWDSKVDFWSALVAETCRARGALCVSVQDLNNTFRRKGTVPLGLETVFQCMARSGKIQRESEFAANVDSGWLSWGVGLLLVKPLKWTFSTLLGGGRVPLDESFVLLDLVKEKAAELLEAYRSSALANRSLLSFPELCALSSHVCVDESSVCIALLQLQRDKQVTVSLHEGEKIVKFSQPGPDRVSPVSDVDVGIYQLQRSEKLLGERVEVLGLEAEKCREEARLLVREGKKSQALRCLRGHKRVEKKIDKLYAQMDTIRGILDKIAQSQTDRLVIQAYQTGVAALRVSLKDVTVERAESLVDQIQELCDTQDEVNQTLAGGVSDLDGDADELEEELRSLLEDDSKPEGISELPQVPSHPQPEGIWELPQVPSHPQPEGVWELPPVPSHPLSPPRDPASDVLSSLPAVPLGCFNITDEELEEELNRLTLADLGLQQKRLTSPTKRLEPAQ